LAFGPIVEFSFENDKSFVNWFILRKAQKLAKFLDAIPEQQRGVPLVLSGHHISAGIAVLAGYFLSNKGFNVTVYAFGLPHIMG